MPAPALGSMVYAPRPTHPAVFDPALITNVISGPAADGSYLCGVIAFLGDDMNHRATPTLVTAQVFTSRAGAAAASRNDGVYVASTV
jgi:hypothetical protein